MQNHNWNDLKYLLALHRTGSLANAGRLLGASETTVARRLRALEASLRVGLFARDRAGRQQVTDAGLTIIEMAERIEAEHLRIAETAGAKTEGLFGTVRITAVPIIANRVLVPRLLAFQSAHPNVTVELVPDPRNLNLSRREADLALRLARPVAGGYGTKARKIGTLAYAVFCAASVRDCEQAGLDWIGYDEAHSGLPHAKWLDMAARDAGQEFPCLRVSDAETAIEAVVAGLGRTILPLIVAASDTRLRRINEISGPTPPERDVWLLSLAPEPGRSAVAAAKKWLNGISWTV